MPQIVVVRVKVPLDCIVLTFGLLDRSGANQPESQAF